MGTSNTRHAFNDCFDLMDQALEDDIGKRIKFIDHGEASHFRLRLYAARKIDRTENNQINGEPRSAYDTLYLTIRPAEEGEGVYLYLEKTSARMGTMEVESLSKGEAQ